MPTRKASRPISHTGIHRSSFSSHSSGFHGSSSRSGAHHRHRHHYSGPPKPFLVSPGAARVLLVVGFIMLPAGVILLANGAVDFSQPMNFSTGAGPGLIVGGALMIFIGMFLLFTGFASVSATAVAAAPCPSTMNSPAPSTADTQAPAANDNPVAAVGSPIPAMGSPASVTSVPALQEHSLPAMAPFSTRSLSPATPDGGKACPFCGTQNDKTAFRCTKCAGQL